MRTNVIVTLQVEGFHNWKDAREKFPKMGFLADNHRHIFHITAKKKVMHSDRDTEIIDLKRQIENYLFRTYKELEEETVCYFGGMSCEMIAQEILGHFSLEYVSVLEDNENGAEVWR